MVGLSATRNGMTYGCPIREEGKSIGCSKSHKSLKPSSEEKRSGVCYSVLARKQKEVVPQEGEGPASALVSSALRARLNLSAPRKLQLGHRLGRATGVAFTIGTAEIWAQRSGRRSPTLKKCNECLSGLNFGLCKVSGRGNGESTVEERLCRVVREYSKLKRIRWTLA